jgi:prophage regulatory protein
MSQEITTLKLHQVLAKTGVGKTTLYDMIAKGKFPAPIPTSDRCRVWLEAEVDQFLLDRADTRNIHAAAN